MPAVVVTPKKRVTLLTLNRTRKRNALDMEDRQELVTALRQVQGDPSCHAIVLTGAGGTFCAGGDIRGMRQDKDDARTRLAVVADLTRLVARSPQPVIAAVEGEAMGLGLALAAACDYVVAARNARLAASFGRLGLSADTGLTWSLSRRVGVARAQEMVLFATEVEATRAFEIGLVSELADTGQALRLALERAAAIARASRPMVRGTKELFGVEVSDLDKVLEAESDLQTRLLAGPDFHEGRAAFLERRPARFGSDVVDEGGD